MSHGWLVILLVAPVYAADVTLSGHVADEDGAPVSGVRIAVHAAANADFVLQTQTGPSGGFEVVLPGPGDYLIDAERQGYYALKNRSLHMEASQELSLTISAVKEVFQSVDVNEQVSPVDIAQTHNQEHLTGTEILDVPYTNGHSLRESMQLMPGVLMDPGGALHFNGSQESQVQYLLNGFNITDPITNQFDTLLASEGVRELAYTSARDSPQFGKGSAGVLAIRAETGTDMFHYTATDFIPGVSIQKGIRLGDWYPRFGVSGPILRGKAWFSDTFASEYTNALVTGLPSGQDTRGGWAGSNLLHMQWNLTPSQILFADFLVNVNNQSRVGLGPLDPISTTSNTRTREYFGSIKDQIVLGRALAEFGYAHNDFDDARTPQGSGLYVFSPAGRSGNYFVDSRQSAARDQGLAHLYLPVYRFAGTHQIEVGADGDLLHYNADFHRTGYEVIGLSGQLLSETMFQGSGVFHLPDAEMSSYILDTWRVAPRFQLSLGLRQDWERRTGDLAWSPRAAFSWAPLKSGRTRIAGGYSITRDAVPLETLGRPLDQSALTTEYPTAGSNFAGMPAGPAALTTFAIPNGSLKLPRAANWSMNVDHKVTEHILVTAKYLRRRLTDGFVYLNTLDPQAPPSELPVAGGAAPGIYQLGSIRRDDYDSEQISVRQTLSGQYEWMVSFVHSRAVSNAFLDSNALDPQQALPYFAPMPWNAPNRVLGWAYLPFPQRLPKRLQPKKWAVAILADARSGFPFSVQDQAGLVVGSADSHRYPFTFDLNVALERVVTLRGYRFALRGGIDNLTNQGNPTAVINTIGSPQYLQFLGQEGRHYVVRIRFFGRAVTK